MFESTEAPFDCVYWMPVRTRTSDAQAVDAFDTVAKYLALEGTPDARASLRSCRMSPTPREKSPDRSLTLKKVSYASLAEQKRNFV